MYCNYFDALKPYSSTKQHHHLIGSINYIIRGRKLIICDDRNYPVLLFFALTLVTFTR